MCSATSEGWRRRRRASGRRWPCSRSIRRRTSIWGMSSASCWAACRGRRCYRRVEGTRAADPRVSYALGTTLMDQERLAEAEACYRRALELSPDHADAHAALGQLHRIGRRFADSEACFRQALELQPANADFHSRFAVTLLSTGDYERGWAEYEWRLRLPMRLVRSFAEPAWQGEATWRAHHLAAHRTGPGRHATVRAFRSPREAAGRHRAARMSGRGLVALFQGSAGIDRTLTPGGAAPAFDVQASLLSLPAILKTTLATLPAPLPNLAADAALVERRRAELSGYPEFKIGIVWQGNPRFAQLGCRIADMKRSIPLAHFEPVARVPGVRLFSLQKGYGTEQLAERRGQETLAERRRLSPSDGVRRPSPSARRPSPSAGHHPAGRAPERLRGHGRCHDEPRPDYFSGHFTRSSRWSARTAGVGSAAVHELLALAGGPRRQPLVSDHASLPPVPAGRVGRRVRPHEQSVVSSH